MTRQVVLDTETTGLSAENGDRIIELGCVELFSRKLTGNDLHIYFNPGRESHEDALKVHGLTSDFLRDKPKFATLANDIVEYLRDAELIIHNAAFDVGFLNKEFELAGLPPLRSFVGDVTDTLALAKTVYPGKRNSLDALCDRFGVDRSNRTFHGAKLDAQLLADVYINLTRGQDALLIDIAANEPVQGRAMVAVDLRSFVLPVLTAADHELAAHEELLLQLDKASNGRTIFRQAAENAVA
ncbi:DNA polymerase III subunit epsilon [Variovorax sp. WS11]|uniref:DNA polymerase III subunit epsilon n=1 Tax=Variovorax sp. WS11 TaxID=1105204 RepID=UPI000D0D4663|nr:DNA polymerase III subunit epsilon [Variovorax sp. WS11]NDZ11961.1 DNA polymerase III subunit epsilon [Variovorax sp. WS11]PSL82719.1 DNA polymerase III subunit epsilon [Variovorax sp. WS11]